MRIKIKIFFAWYDFWVGIYFSRKEKKIYLCPVPCFGIEISLHKKKGIYDDPEIMW